MPSAFYLMYSVLDESENETDSSIPATAGKKNVSSNKIRKKKGKRGFLLGSGTLKSKSTFKCTNFIKVPCLVSWPGIEMVEDQFHTAC